LVIPSLVGVACVTDLSARTKSASTPTSVLASARRDLFLARHHAAKGAWLFDYILGWPGRGIGPALGARRRNLWAADSTALRFARRLLFFFDAAMSAGRQGPADLAPGVREKNAAIVHWLQLLSSPRPGPEEDSGPEADYRGRRSPRMFQLRNGGFRGATRSMKTKTKAGYDYCECPTHSIRTFLVSVIGPGFSARGARKIRLQGVSGLAASMLAHP